MSRLYRFGIAVEDELVESFDRIAEGIGYDNRSEAIRDLMRQFVVEHGAETQNREVVGAIAMVFDHKKRELHRKLTEYQHHHYGEVVATLHIHLDESKCLEILAVKGKSGEIKKIANGLFTKKGVLFGKLIITTIAE